ncbi:hypothetical protein T440DRAFT_481779 [Plenodomus tracheiphilus IPT5]|uniref:Uncharacterized protein n=1 Tax=Plenodomus tracheiphilus IPT5 TaxID=1408161 RepID=A0A6A7AW84_9PLEO|nr:hypothetical protein T440DRAFT_481779 [Plenodomus tracheiphilus IPT5]
MAFTCRQGQRSIEGNVERGRHRTHHVSFSPSDLGQFEDDHDEKPSRGSAESPTLALFQGHQHHSESGQQIRDPRGYREAPKTGTIEHLTENSNDDVAVQGGRFVSQLAPNSEPFIPDTVLVIHSDEATIKPKQWQAYTRHRLPTNNSIERLRSSDRGGIGATWAEKSGQSSQESEEAEIAAINEAWDDPPFVPSDTRDADTKPFDPESFLEYGRE